MTNKKLQEYVDDDLVSATLAGGEHFYITQSSASARTTTDDLKTYVLDGIGTNVFRPEDYGAKGDAIGFHDGVYDNGTGVFTSTSYTFTASDLAEAATKKVYFAGTDGSPRTITSIVGSGITVSPSISGISSPGILWLMSTDDTAAVQAACDAARAVQGNDVDEVSSGGIDQMIMSSGAVILTPGKRYGVFNSSASYNGGAGKISAITIYRRMYFGGENDGFNQSGIVLIPGSYGHCIANAGSTSHTDFIQLANFSIFGYDVFSPNGLDGIYLNTPLSGFDKTDALNRIENVNVYKAPRHGFYFKGRGELNVNRCQAFSCGQYGIFFDGQYDWKMAGCAFGGNLKTGVRIFSGGGQVTNTKSFYNGIGGAANDEDSANLVVDGDPSSLSRQGVTYFSNFQCQESWGCGAVIKAGVVEFDASCQFLDPARSTMGGGTRPTIKAGLYLKGEGCRHVVFGGVYVGPSVALYESPNWPADTFSVYIDGFVSSSGPQLCKGDIYTYLASVNTGGGAQLGTQYSGTGAAVGGGGATNGANPSLRIDGKPLANTLTSVPAGGLFRFLDVTDTSGGAGGTEKLILGSNLSSFPFTTTSATAGSIGPNGSTNPALQVDASAATLVNGIKISGKATGVSPRIDAIGTTADVDITVSSKGSGGNAIFSAGNFAQVTGGGSQFNMTATQFAWSHAFRTSNTGYVFNNVGGTGLTASTECLTFDFNMSGGAMQYTAGAKATQRDAYMRGVTNTATSATTITDAATFEQDGAPVASTNVSQTNAYTQRLRGKNVGAGTTNSYGSWVEANTTATNNYVQSLNGSAGEIVRVRTDGQIKYLATNTAGGTTGNRTINQPSGTVNFAAAATSLTVTNSLCTTSSIVFAVVRTNDTTAVIKNVVPGSGSFVITLNAAATAETSVGFLIIN